MQSWIYFAMAAQLIWAFTSVTDKIVISKGYIKSPFVYIVLNGAMNIFLILLLPFFSFEPLGFFDFIVALFAGIFLSTAVTLYYKAVQYDEISRIKIMFQLQPILVLALAFLLLGEVLTKSQAAGFLFLLAAGILISYRKVNGSFRLSRAFYLVLMAMFFAAFYAVSAKYVFSVTGFWSGFLWLRLANFSALAVLLAPSVRKQFVETFKAMPGKIRGLLGSKMVVDFSAFVFANYALLKGPVSLVGVLEAAVAPLFVLGITLFTSLYLPHIVKEGINKKAILTKALAILFVVIGIVFINL